MAFPPVKIRPNDGILLDAIKKITRLSKAEILTQAISGYLDNLPVSHRNMIDDCLKDVHKTNIDNE